MAGCAKIISSNLDVDMMITEHHLDVYRPHLSHLYPCHV